jgi:hypothetical protein
VSAAPCAAGAGHARARRRSADRLRDGHDGRRRRVHDDRARAPCDRPRRRWRRLADGAGADGSREQNTLITTPSAGASCSAASSAPASVDVASRGIRQVYNVSSHPCGGCSEWRTVIAVSDTVVFRPDVRRVRDATPVRVANLFARARVARQLVREFLRYVPQPFAEPGYVLRELQGLAGPLQSMWQPVYGWLQRPQTCGVEIVVARTCSRQGPVRDNLFAPGSGGVSRDARRTTGRKTTVCTNGWAAQATRPVFRAL